MPCSSGSSVRIPAGDEQRGLARDAEVRRAGVVTIAVFAWWNPLYHQASLRGRLRSWRRASRQGQRLQLSLFQDTSDWPPFVLLCRASDVQRSGPGPGRRAHEAAQRQTQFLDHVLRLGNLYHKTTVAGFFTEPLEPDAGKPCENSLKTHLAVPLFF